MISIIVPVYGVEKYIRHCLDSLLNQTYKELEIILVDDGSPDRSGEICDEYALLDPRVKVIHQKNSGAGAARNAGLDVASGDYIGFVDPDDTVNLAMYEHMMHVLSETGADLCICNYGEVKESEDYLEVIEQQKTKGIVTKDELKYHIISSKEEKIQYSFLQKYVDSILIWNKLFQKEFWKDRRFPELPAYEDEAVIYQSIYEARKIVYIENFLYNYLLRSSGSLTTQAFSKKRLTRLDVILGRLKFYEERSEWDYYFEMVFVLKTDLLRVTEMIEESKEFSLSILKPYKKQYNKICFSTLNKCNVSFKKKISYWWYAMLPKMYYKHFKGLN